MATLGLTLHLDVPAGWERMMESLGETLSNAHCEVVSLELTSEDGGIYHQGLPVTRFGKLRAENGKALIPLAPGVGLPGFASSVLGILPPRATVEWLAGWPIFKCPPHDDRDDEGYPEPLVPDELILA